MQQIQIYCMVGEWLEQLESKGESFKNIDFQMSFFEFLVQFKLNQMHLFEKMDEVCLNCRSKSFFNSENRASSDNKGWKSKM